MDPSAELVRRDRGPFGLPRGPAGWLAGRLMAADDSQQRELVDWVRLPDQGSFCEVGFGPGILLRLVSERCPSARLSGVDPSTVMLRQAHRTLGATAPGANVDLRLGAAGRLPFDDDLFDVTVSVNTVVFWPVLAAGLAEMARVARPGSVVMLAWHGGTSPSRIQRRLLLDHDTLTDVAVEMGAHFANVDHKRLRQSELLIASC